MHELAQTRDLAAFVAVVEDGGFSEAARRLNVAPSSLSRTIAKLEQTLGVTLLRRTTRSIDLTPEGAEVLQIARDVLLQTERLRDVREASRSPRGPLRINAAVPFVLHVLIPALPEFRELYPDIDITLSMTDSVVDLIGAHADVAIRLGRLENSELIVRPLGVSQWRLVAAPGYIAKNGTPKTVADLKRLQQVRFTTTRHINELRFKGEPSAAAVPASVQADNGEAVRHLVLNGMGISRLSDFLVDADIAAGRLVELLPGQLDAPPMDISAVYFEPASRSRRLETFLEFMRNHLKA
ncbi:LysR family transcriptional regulator [Leisingera sp. D0M16]|uniref:LysR family transcriptional regulator n=1 Tax=Leisingera coralii TaxID=3351347 RepID=UPI003B9EFCEE